MIDDDQWIFKGGALFPRVHAADKTTIIKDRIGFQENLQETMGFYMLLPENTGCSCRFCL